MTTLTDSHWDAIIIGTGIGGGIIGRALAEAGQKVLFLEKGPAPLPGETRALSDHFLPEARLVRGLWPTPLQATIDGRDSQFFAPLGAGLGGSSTFYAGTLERPEPHDLEDQPDRPHPTGGWPIPFDHFAKSLDRASALFQLYGTRDPLGEDAPLNTPPAFTKTESALVDNLQKAGLHPYHAHSAARSDTPDARPLNGHSAGVAPALASGNATLQTRAEVTRLIANSDQITGVQARIDGVEHQLSATRYIIAGGALGSPHLLLNSSSENWPDGIANRSGQVGRNLMFHLNEMFALWPRGNSPEDGPSKSIALRDFYHHQGQRLGMVQSMGVQASYGEIVFYLNQMLARSRFANLPLLSQLTRLPAALAARMFRHAQSFVGLLEDLPYETNRVLPGAQLRISYDLAPELLARRKLFRRAINKALRGQRRFCLNRGPELNFGHPCGTLRIGTDPTKSVLRPDGRSHDMHNLWVADASFMPSSMGVNPSLSIAAFALHVADHILKEAP
jgi:choline dehydrogenase-like flavoprotein